MIIHYVAACVVTRNGMNQGAAIVTSLRNSGRFLTIPLTFLVFTLLTVLFDKLTLYRHHTKMKKKFTLNCIRYPALPLVHTRFHGTPPEKTTFPPEFSNYLYTIYMYTNNNHISGRKNINFLYRFKIAAK